MPPVRTIGLMLFALLMVSVLSPDANARSRHGTYAHKSSRMDSAQEHGARSTRSHRTGTNTRLNAAADDADRLLNTRIKSICRGC